MEMTLIIAAMTAATFPVRYLPMLILKRIRIGEKMKAAMQIMPLCIMASMITVDLAGNADTLWQRLAALTLVLAAVGKFENIGLGVVAGVAAYSFLA